MKNMIPLWISNRHIHLSSADAEILFGSGYECQKIKDLTQPGQFACAETLSLKWPKGQIDGVRVLGPYRNATQVEILQGDNFKLWTKAPIRLSGDLAGSDAIELIWPQGHLQLKQWLIVAQRHLHATPEDAQRLWLQDGQMVSVAVQWERAIVFGATVVRVSETSKLDMHIDVEEGNAAGLITCTYGELIS
jgi:propanediol utilization protein